MNIINLRMCAQNSIVLIFIIRTISIIRTRTRTPVAKGVRFDRIKPVLNIISNYCHGIPAQWTLLHNMINCSRFLVYKRKIQQYVNRQNSVQYILSVYNYLVIQTSINLHCRVHVQQTVFIKTFEMLHAFVTHNSHTVQTDIVCCAKGILSTMQLLRFISVVMMHTMQLDTMWWNSNCCCATQ